jgi:hypothetical protein
MTTKIAIHLPAVPRLGIAASAITTRKSGGSAKEDTVNNAIDATPKKPTTMCKILTRKSDLVCPWLTVGVFFMSPKSMLLCLWPGESFSASKTFVLSAEKSTNALHIGHGKPDPLNVWL